MYTTGSSKIAWWLTNTSLQTLGDNALSKYVVPIPDNSYKAAVVIFAPLHLSSCNSCINQDFSKIYQKILLYTLKGKALEKVKR